jgi:DNA invertase Pin-like site-specific DNA recombinase
MTRAIGVVRISRVGGREGERFLSPTIQRERIEDGCKRHELQLIDVLDEPNVSGGRAIAKRPALAAALAAVERGQAGAIVFGYRDRADRSIIAGAELCRRMDAADALLIAGGEQITHATHEGWRRATMESFMSEDVRRALGDRMADVQDRCVERGVPPWSRVALGYTRQENGTLAPNPAEVPIVREAFEMRAAGASVMKIHAMLKARGVSRSYRGVQVMLANRAYLGELRFGDRFNAQAWEPIIDPQLFEKAQRLVTSRGPQPRATQLLSRLRILRCGSCGKPLGTMQMQKQGPIYRCGSSNDCPRHMTVTCAVADQVIVSAVRAALADVEGRASTHAEARGAAEQATGAREALDAAVLAFDGLGDLAAARERLAQLRQAAEDAEARAEELGAASHGLALNGGRDWDVLTRDEQRDLIAATVKRAIVGPGRGAERITVELFGEDTSSSAV